MIKAQIGVEEAELWNRFRADDEVAFSQIFSVFSDTLYSYGCRLHPDKELVKDCLQDLFVNIWNKRHSLGPTTSIKYYLFRSLRREIALRAKERGVMCAMEDDTSHVGNDDSAEISLIKEEEETYLHRHLNQAILELSERQREAIYLRFYQNMEFSDIAVILEISPRAVYKLIYRAIDVLQNKFYVSPSPAPNASFNPFDITYSEQELQIDALVGFMVLSNITFFL